MMLRKFAGNVFSRRGGLCVARTMSTQQQHAAPSAALPSYRIRETDPASHNSLHQGKFYAVPPAVYNKLLVNRGLGQHYQQLVRLLGECCLMVRQPALEIKSFMERADYSKPPVTYLLYGRLGMGKTATLAHLLHYCHSQQWLLLHVPEVFLWVCQIQEVTPSQQDPRLKDTSKECALWLQSFFTINKALLDSLELRTTQRYEWSQREVTEEGAPLTDLVDMGIKRPLYATECVRCLLQEVAAHSHSGKFRTLVSMDGINYCFGQTFILTLKTQFPARDLGFLDAFLDIISNQKIKNSAVLLTLNNYHYDPALQTHDYMPSALLGAEGMETLDPFIPVLVDKLSPLEFHNYLDYFCDSKWIQSPHARTEEGRKELWFLSGGCPGELEKIVSPL